MQGDGVGGELLEGLLDCASSGSRELCKGFEGFLLVRRERAHGATVGRALRGVKGWPVGSREHAARELEVDFSRLRSISAHGDRFRWIGERQRTATSTRLC